MRLAEQILDGAISQQQKLSGEKKEREFILEVRETVESRIGHLRNAKQLHVREVLSDVDAERKAWEERLHSFVGGENVGDTERIGAAGVNVKGGDNRIVMSKKTTDLHVQNDGYWKRVFAHERVHQRDQATQFDRKELFFLNRSGAVEKATVIGDLTEHHAIRGAKQPDGDLVPSYVEHTKKGDRIEELVGKAAYERAMASGEMQELQDTIMNKQRALFTKNAS